MNAKAKLVEILAEWYPYSYYNKTPDECAEAILKEFVARPTINVKVTQEFIQWCIDNRVYEEKK